MQTCTVLAPTAAQFATWLQLMSKLIITEPMRVSTEFSLNFQFSLSVVMETKSTKIHETCLCWCDEIFSTNSLLYILSVATFRSGISNAFSSSFVSLLQRSFSSFTTFFVVQKSFRVACMKLKRINRVQSVAAQSPWIKIPKGKRFDKPSDLDTRISYHHFELIDFFFCSAFPFLLFVSTLSSFGEHLRQTRKKARKLKWSEVENRIDKTCATLLSISSTSVVSAVSRAFPFGSH